MATFYLSPFGTLLQLFSDAGVVGNGDLIWTYQAGTSTPVATYTDNTGSTPNGNPIILNSAGRLPNVSIWQQGGVAVKFIFSTNAGTPSVPVMGVQIGPTFDNVSGINDFSLANSLLANPASGDGADLVANAVRSYDVFATARAANVPVLQAGQTLIVIFEGGVSIADALGGAFYWNALSTAADDGVNIISPTGLSAGRYIRLQSLGEQYAVKPGTTSIASSTAITIDPDLQIPLLITGTYNIEGWINDQSGTSAGGLAGEIAFSGTVHAGGWSMNGPTASSSGVTAVSVTALGTSAELQSAQAGVASMKLDGFLQCSTTGTVSFKWAQQSSNGTASVVGPGSWLRVRRLAATTGSFVPATHTFSTPGTFTETIPNGATTATIEDWGGSGGGNKGVGSGCGASDGPGGGSGGYCLTVINVASANGQTISITVGSLGGALGGNGTATTVSSGTFSLTTMSAGGGQGGAGGSGGAGGTASGGNTTNTAGNAGQSGAGGGSGGSGIVGTNGTGAGGGNGGLGAAQPGTPGGNGKVIIKYT